MEHGGKHPLEPETRGRCCCPLVKISSLPPNQKGGPPPQIKNTLWGTTPIFIGSCAVEGEGMGSLCCFFGAFCLDVRT